LSGKCVVDPSGWLEYLAATDRADLFAEAIGNTENLIVPVVSIYEVFKKTLRDRSEELAVKAVGAMLHGRVVEIDLTLALEAAKLKLPMADSIIYATAQRYDATLWTQDLDFRDLPGVNFFPNENLRSLHC